MIKRLQKNSITHGRNKMDCRIQSNLIQCEIDKLVDELLRKEEEKLHGHKKNFDTNGSRNETSN